METDEYREKGTLSKGLRIVLGIFMIVIYVGMGVLFFIDLFGWAKMAEPWPVLNYIVGVILVLYGIYRAYRLYKGIDSPI